MADPQVTPIDVLFDTRTQLAHDRDKFTFILPEQLQNIVAMQILWVNVPFTFYAIDETCNMFYISFPFQNADSAPPYNSDPTKGWAIYIKPGTYTPLGLQQEIRRALNSADIGTNPDFPVTFYLLIDSFDARATLYNNYNDYGGGAPVPSGLAFRLRFPSRRLAEIFGFEPDVTYISDHEVLWQQGIRVNEGITVQRLKGPKCVKLLGEAMLHLNSTALASEMQNAVKSADQMHSNRIMSMPINNNYGSYMIQMGNQQIVSLNRPQLNSVDLYFTHGNNTLYASRADSVFNGDAVKYVDFLPFNGEGFQVCVRFFKDNGIKAGT